MKIKLKVTTKLPYLKFFNRRQTTFQQQVIKSPSHANIFLQLCLGTYSSSHLKNKPFFSQGQELFIRQLKKLQGSFIACLTLILTMLVVLVSLQVEFSIMDWMSLSHSYPLCKLRLKEAPEGDHWTLLFF